MENFIKEFLLFLEKNKNRSPATIRNYQGYLTKFSAYLKRIEKKFNEISLVDLEIYTGPYLHKANFGISSRSSAISAIRQFYVFCERRGAVEKSPALLLEHPVKGESLPGILSLSDIEKLMFAPDMSTFKGLRDAAIMAFLFSTGCRVSGLTSLNENQLIYGGDENSNRLYVILREKGKKERKLPLNRKTELLLFSYIHHEEMKKIDRVTGNTKVVFVNIRNTHVSVHEFRGEKRRLSRKSIGEILKKYGKKVGIDKSLLHAHAGRHTFGTHLYDAGIAQEDRQAAMGHESADTLSIYTRLSERRLLKVADQANPLSKIKTPIDELMKSVFNERINKNE